jgi:hypothetical protein
LIKKIKIKFLVVNFISILDHQTLDPDPGSAIRKNAGSGSVLNQSGSETLIQGLYGYLVHDPDPYCACGTRSKEMDLTN